jgi:hypothetical protein
MDDSPVVTDPIRVFVLDDHEIVRRGIADLFESADGLVVVGEAGTAAEASGRPPERCRARRPPARRQWNRCLPRHPVDDAGGALLDPHLL